jgi:hypothetical protein
VRKFSALTHSVLGLYHGIPERCPTRNFYLEVLNFGKFLKREVMKREVEEQRSVHGRQEEERIITAVLEQENVFRATCIRQAAGSMG